MALTQTADIPETESARLEPVHQGTLLTVDALARFQDRWDEVQEAFVLKPGRAALQAEDLIQDIGEALAASTVRRRTDLAHVSAGSVRFPEELWITLQRCRLLMTAIQSATKE